MPRKMNPDATHGNKILYVFADLFFTGRARSMTELANMLQCSKPTVRRIIDDISSAYDINIHEETKGQRVFFQIQRPKRASLMPISIKEIAVMEMCQAFASHLLGSSLFEMAARGTLKSYGLLPENQQDEPSGRDGFACIYPGTIDYTPCQDNLQKLVEAIANKKVCKVTYQALSADKPSRLFITPFKIFSHKDTIYVHACRSNNNGKPRPDNFFHPLLAVHRFKEVEVLPATYSIPQTYDFESIFNSSFGVMKDDAFTVEAKFTGWAAKFVQERFWSPEQKLTKNADGSLSVTFTASSEPEVMGWILSFGHEGELVKPARLRKRLTKSLEKMTALYKGS
ncbi:MAG: WYL domain-containing protein [Desulfatibacillaceae bacterium]|nr:WYL domain-containing protein [Desulfatibacillaceae bacterium]